MRCQISTLNPQMKPQFLWFGFEASIVIKETKTILIMETAMTDPIRYKQNDAFSSPLPVTSEWTNRISPYWKMPLFNSDWSTDWSTMVFKYGTWYWSVWSEFFISATVNKMVPIEIDISEIKWKIRETMFWIQHDKKFDFNFCPIFNVPVDILGQVFEDLLRYNLGQKLKR